MAALMPAQFGSDFLCGRRRVVEEVLVVVEVEKRSLKLRLRLLLVRLVRALEEVMVRSVVVDVKLKSRSVSEG